MTRAAVLTALAVGAVYLGWRVGWTRTGAQSLLFWMLWLAEVSIWLSLVQMTFERWTLACDPPLRPTTPRSVDVVVICDSEPIEVLRATLIGCVAMNGRHRTVALDAGNRADVAQLASALGIDRLAVTDVGPTAAPEVRLNAVLEQLDGELLAVLHGDDVPLPTMLEHLVGDFDDESVWLAQGRQAVYGPSAGEYRESAEESGLFFGVVQPGRNHHGAAQWCGSGGILRRRAVEELGGVPPTTDTPRFQMSLIAHEAGWVSRYHHEAVVLTLARPDVEGYVAQRARWAAGNIQSLRTRQSPLFAPGLSATQRLSYIGTLVKYLGGPRRLALMVILTATLLSGALPVFADPLLLVTLWGLWIGCFVLARRLLARGHGAGFGGTRGQWLLLGAHVTAWLSLLVPRSVARALRSPVHTATHRHRRPRLHTRLLLGSTTVVAIAAVARLVSGTGVITLPAMPLAATALALTAAASLVAVVTIVLTGALQHQRRYAPRFSVESTARVGGVKAPLLDVSERGASVRLPKPPRVGCPYVVGLFVPGLDGSIHQATVAAEVRSVRPSPAPERGHVVGLSFTHLSATARDRLAEYCRVLLPARAAAVAIVDEPEPTPGHLRRSRRGNPTKTSPSETMPPETSHVG